MGQWYCHTGGQQYGPIEESVLRQWIAEGRVRPEDLVWSPGMDAWRAARETFGLGFAPVDWSAAPGTVGVPSRGGTGGATDATGLMGMGWRNLSGRWGMAVAFNVLFLLIFLGIWLVDAVIGSAVNLVLVPLVSPARMRTSVNFNLVQLALEGAMTLGATIFYLTYHRRGPVHLGMLFEGFRRYLTTLGLHLLQTILILLFGVVAALPGGIAAALLFLVAKEEEAAAVVGIVFALIPMVVAMIIAGLRYSQAFYILAEDPRMGILDALSRSVRIMKGHKGRLFVMQLLFGLIILGCLIVICVGWVLGLLFVIPWISMASAAFYDDLKPPAAAIAGTVASAAPIGTPGGPAGSS